MDGIIDNSSYYIIKEKYDSDINLYKYVASFYTQDGIYITDRSIKYNERLHQRIERYERILDPKFIYMARPITIKFCNHIHGGKCAIVLDKNNNILYNQRYNGDLNRVSFINYQLDGCPNPILLDYKWLIGNDISFIDATKIKSTRRNKGMKCLIQ